MDKWKGFYQENSDEFHSEEPSSKVWNAIQQSRFPERKTVPLNWVIGIVASLVLVIGLLSSLLINKRNYEVEMAENPQENSEMVLSSIAPNLLETEVYYLSRIKNAQEELSDVDLDPTISEVMEELDNEFSQLSKEADQKINQDEIVQAMIENYRMKLELLEKVLDELKESQTELE